MSIRSLTLTALLLTGACAHKAVSLDGCDLPAVPIGAAVAASRDPAAAPASDAATTYEDLLRGALQTSRSPGPAASADPARPALLFLSGGGQHGAFGAGLLDEWRVQGGGLPAFRVVTGISTGALLGSFAFTGATQKGIDGYTIDGEQELLDVKARGLLAQVREGAAGTLDPLRATLDRLLDPALLGEVAAAGADGRKFLVGVVDVRGGEAEAIDMTALAQRWAAAGADKARIKQCYIEVLVASSSVPLAAPPVYIDSRMYIDGGARFGLFKAAEDRVAAGMTRAPQRFLVVNGTLETRAQCPFETTKGADCPTTGKLRDWDLVDLGLRSVDILQNQIYRFSAEAAGSGDPEARFVRIGPEAKAHVFAATDLPGETGALSCAAWRARDKLDRPEPVQFEKRYMRCLIDFGRATMRDLRWWQAG